MSPDRIAPGARHAMALRTAICFGPSLGRAIALLRLTNGELGDDAFRAAFANPFLRVAGGAFPEASAAPCSGLYAHVAAAIGLMPLDREGRRIAEVFLEHLEPSGWLGASLGEVAAAAGVSIAEAGTVLDRLQEIEPAGLFARSLSECLELQAREQGILTAEVAAVLGALAALAEGGLAGLAAASGLAVETAAAALAVLRRLDPKPGARFAADEPALLRPPDILASRTGGGWRVELNPATLPEVEVLACPEGAGPAQRRAAAEARAYARAIQRRNGNVRAVAAALVARQAPFLARESEFPAPLARAEVAAEAGVHESTVSRIALAMTMDTPRGVVGLAALFARGAPGRAWSLPALRARIVALIAAEPPGRPLGDGAIAARLAAEGLAVPRRSVARHRDAAGFPPRSERQGPAPRADSDHLSPAGAERHA